MRLPGKVWPLLEHPSRTEQFLQRKQKKDPLFSSRFPESPKGVSKIRDPLLKSADLLDCA